MKLATPGYEQLTRRIREVVRDCLPLNATVLVASRGDSELLRLDGRRGWHFPRNEQGKYAGFYPADSEAAIAHLEDLRTRGAEYLLFPSTALWWLDHYAEFAQHLESRYTVVIRDDEVCLIFALHEQFAPSGEALGAWKSPVRRQQFVRQFKEVVRSLLPTHAVVAVVSLGDDALLSLDGQQGLEFPATASDSHSDQALADGSQQAIDELSSLRQQGAQFLVVPSTAFEWLEQSPGLAAHLKDRDRLVTHQSRVCEIYELSPPADDGAGKRSLGQRLRDALRPGAREVKPDA